MTDLVSVVVPCFNHAEYVERTLDSILQQTYRDIEVIVVDDCSKDGSPEVIRRVASRDSRVRVVLHEVNKGASHSRNDGIEAARGDLLAFCDADDIWLAGKLDAQVKLLRDSAESVLAYCDSEVIDEHDQIQGHNFSDLYHLPEPADGSLFAALCGRNFINTQTVMLRRSALPGMRPFDQRIKWVEDWWLWLQLSRRGPFVYDPLVLARYRVHARSTSRAQQPGIARNRFKVLKRNLRAHADLSVPVQAEMWYGMGRALHAVGKRRRGRAFMSEALLCSLRGGSYTFSDLRFATRWLQSALRLGL